MTDFFALLTRTAALMSLVCEADRLPPPTGLSYKWLDAFTVHLSWLKPAGLPRDCEIAYKVQSGKEEPSRTSLRNITFTCLGQGEEAASGCTYVVQTVSSDSEFCDWNASEPATVHTEGLLPRDEVMKDFKCIAYADKIDCSWEPVNLSLNLSISYRVCGKSEKDRVRGLKACDQLYGRGARSGCCLRGDVYTKDICMLVESEAGRSTFKPEYALPSPKLNIKEDGDQLRLSWTPPEIGKACSWTYELCYTRCAESQKCINFTTRGNPLLLPYDKKCRYEFKFRVRSSTYCTKICSDFSEAAYGTNEPPDGTMTVVAIVIPVILSVCVILSCYCFRRHSAIICPTIPDPSAIFKEMMMNGNKELKTGTETLYTPVPETVEPCKLTMVPQNNVLLQNS